MRRFLLAAAIAATTLLGTPAAMAQGSIIIVNGDAPNEGFNDPTPVAPVAGNPFTTRGGQRQFVFLFGADIWESRLQPTNDIRVTARFEPLGPNVLGSAGAVTASRNFPGAEYPDTWYHAALADRLAGTDLVPGFFDIRALFSSDFNFYYGTDNNEPPGTVDLLPVVLHELGHGLGFANFVTEATGSLLLGGADIYSQYTLDVTTKKNWNSMTNAERQASAINVRKVSWDGVHVNKNVPAVLHRGDPALRVVNPGGLGSFAVGLATFGPALTATGVAAPAVLADDGVAPTGDACEPLPAGSGTGKILIVDRGLCAFALKVKNAQDAGAKGVVVVDNVQAAPPPGMAGVDPTIVIPSVRVSLNDGNTLKANLTDLRLKLFIDTGILAGMDRVKRLMMVAALNPVVAGSSISHFDTAAFPNQLMEPAINADLTSSVDPPQDLTSSLMTDLGWFTDADSTPDGRDACIGSDLRPGVFIGTCNANTNNIMLPPGGCTLSDELNWCDANTTNHDAYMQCVRSHTANWVRDWFITSTNRQSILACAAGNTD